MRICASTPLFRWYNRNPSVLGLVGVMGGDLPIIASESRVEKRIELVAES